MSSARGAEPAKEWPRREMPGRRVVFEPGLSSHPREAPDALWGGMVVGC